jgi:cell division septation protein DedD
MRIDYSPPKQSYVTPQSKPRPRKEPVGLFTSIIVITALIAFAVGFSSGWFLSERSTKKAFQAAAEQNSLEDSTKQVTAPPQPVQPQPQPQPAAPATPQQPVQPPAAPATPQPAPQTAPLPQLSFYKTLPGGQKSALLGSGINRREERERQPLQAAIPANVSRRQQAATPKPPQEKEAAAEKPAVEKPVSSDKATASATKTRGGYTVQIASYTVRSDAEAMKSKLAGKGYNAIISESDQGDNGTWYRVRVGRKLEQEAARELAGKIGKGAIAIPE